MVCKGRQGQTDLVVEVFHFHLLEGEEGGCAAVLEDGDEAFLLALCEIPEY